MGQLNANLSEQMVMRVGIPHRGGGLAFHAFEENYPVMVSANAFWNPVTETFVIPETTDLHELDLALDSAGYQSASRWVFEHDQTPCI